MKLKAIFLSAALAFGALGAVQSEAATCTVGTCSVTGADGQALSGSVLFDIDAISHGPFVFSANFLNDQPQNGFTIAVGLGGLLGTVSNLVFEIVSPAGIAATYNLVQNTPTKIILQPSQGSIIDFTLSGDSVAGLGGTLPDVNLLISAVPLPAGVLLMGTALAGFGVMRRRRKAA